MHAKNWTLEIALLLVIVSTASWYSLPKPAQPAPATVPISYPTAEQTATAPSAAGNYVDPEAFSAVRKEVDPDNQHHYRLATLQPGGQQLFELGQARIPKQGVWLDSPDRIAVMLSCDDNGTTHHLVFVQTKATKFDYQYKVSQISLPSRPLLFDATFVDELLKNHLEAQ